MVWVPDSAAPWAIPESIPINKSDLLITAQDSIKLNGRLTSG